MTLNALRLVALRLLEKKEEHGEWVIEDNPGVGRPTTLLLQKNLGRLKKMRKRTLQGVAAYTEKNSASPISKSSAHRGRKQIGHKFIL